MAAPFIRRWNAAKRIGRLRAIVRILGDVKRCASRDELEAVLGRPKYTLDGHLHTTKDESGNERHPDHVEVYLVSGCTIDVLFFFSEDKVEAVGFPSPTAVDVVLGEGVAGSNSDEEKQAQT